MRRQIIKHIIDTGLEIHGAEPATPPAPRRKIVKKRTAEGIIAENAVKITPDDRAVGGHGPFRPAINMQKRAPAIRAASASPCEFHTR